MHSGWPPRPHPRRRHTDGPRLSGEAVLRALPEGIVTLHVDGEISWWNAAAGEILGLPDDRGVGLTLTDARWRWVDADGRDLPGDSHPVTDAVRTGLGSVGALTGLSHPDGRVTWLRVGATRVDAGDGGDGWVVTLCDVSPEVERERRERAVNERLALVLEGSSDGYWDWNIVSGDVAFSERWASMLGYALDEITPHVDSWSRLVHPDDMAGVMQALEAHLRGEVPTYESEHRLRHRDGRWIWVLDRGKVVERGRDGRPLRASGTHTDVTRRHEVEAANAALIAELERAIAEVRQLSGLLPVCAWCRRLRSERGEWTDLEEYVRTHTAASVSHGICPDCESRVRATAHPVGGASGLR